MRIETAYEYYNKYEFDDSIQRYLAQAKARYILYNSQEPVDNFPNYAENLDTRCLHIAFSYINVGSEFNDYGEFELATKCFEKAAGTLEYLYAYKTCDKEYKNYYCLICSLLYYVASHYSKSFIVIGNYASETKLAKIITLFLTRNFWELEKSIQDLFLNENYNYDSDNIIHIKILSIALNNMLAYIKEGNQEYIVQAKKVLYDLIEISKIDNEANIWWVYKLLLLIIDEYVESSLWSILPHIIEEPKNRKQYILANLYKDNPIVELFTSQKRCIYESVKNDNGFVVGMPTSSGKTKIAEISIIRTLSEDPNALCIYIAPFRSLANEIENSMSSLFFACGFVVSNLYGSVQSTRLDREHIDSSNLIIATAEKIKSILRSNDDIDERIKLVVVDEGHLVGAQSRYITSELLIEELRIKLKKNNGKLLLLSAVLPNLGHFSKWISGEESNNTSSNWRPSEQRLGELIFRKNRNVDLFWEGSEETFNRGYIKSKFLRNKKGSGDPIYFPDNKKEAVATTAVKMLTMGSVLIFVGRSNMVMSQARVILKIFKENNMTHTWSKKNIMRHAKLACEEAYGEKSEIYTMLEYGIVCHSSKIPGDVRLVIERLIAEDKPKIIVATSTLGQGVNLGVSTVIISNIYFDQYNKVDAKDFWNIAGRAGRAFIDTEGKILYAIDETKSDFSVGNQKHDKNILFKPTNIQSAKSGILCLLIQLWNIAKKIGIDYNVFLELIAENNTVLSNDVVTNYKNKIGYLYDLIDDTLISMHMDKNSDKLYDNEDWVEEVFKSSLAYIQSEQDDIDIIQIIKARSRGAIKLAGSSHNWKSIACSSVPLRASIFIDENINEIVEQIQQFINTQQNIKNMLSLITYIDQFIYEMPISMDQKSIQIALEYNIRDAWYRGQSPQKIDKIHCKGMDVCTKYYGFHFPWIVNAISKKLKLIGYEEESKILEDIALFSEIGVPNLSSARIYLAGVKSRECAIELSSYIKDDSKNIKKQLNSILVSIRKNDIFCENKTYEWLLLLEESEKSRISISIERRDFTIADIIHDKLYVRKNKDDLYLCNYDYTFKTKINSEVKDYFGELYNIPGIYFQMNHQNILKLHSDNPYISIVE